MAESVPDDGDTVNGRENAASPSPDPTFGSLRLALEGLEFIPGLEEGGVIGGRDRFFFRPGTLRMDADKALLDEAAGQITAIGQLNEAVKAISVENFFAGGVNRESFAPELFVGEFLGGLADRDLGSGGWRPRRGCCRYRLCPCPNRFAAHLPPRYTLVSSVPLAACITQE